MTIRRMPPVAHEACEWSVVAALVAPGLGIALVPRLARLPRIWISYVRR